MHLLFSSGMSLKAFPDLSGTWNVCCGYWGYSAKITFEKPHRKAEVVHAILSWRNHPELDKSLAIWKKATADHREYYSNIIASWARDCIQKTVLVF